MAFVVLFSTMSFTINTHYCGDTLVAASMFSTVKSCGMEKVMETIPLGCSMKKSDCCKNEQTFVKGQDELKLNFDKLSLDQHVFVAVFFHSYNKLFDNFKEVSPSLVIHPPPYVERHIYKLDESYLI